jgi:hypothetical protein
MPAELPGEREADPFQEEAKLPPKRQRLQRRARATLFFALVALILLQGGLRVGIDSYWPELRDPSFEIKGRRLAHLLAAFPKPPISAIMVGSSVTRNAFKAKYLEEDLSRQLSQPTVVVNMSTLGGGPLTELVWTRRLIDRGIRPDFVGIEVTPFLYNTPDVPKDACRFPEHLLSKKDLEVLLRFNPDPQLREGWNRFHWFPSYAHRLTILGYLAEALLPLRDRVPTWGDSLDDRFWTALPPRSPAELSATLVEVRNMFESQLKTFAPGRPSLQALEELLGLLKTKQIPAVVVLAPEGPLMRSLYPKEPLKAFVAKMVDLSRQNDCAFVDAFEWLDEEMFVDSIHPTFAGADAFSTRFERDVLLPTLTKRK